MYSLIYLLIRARVYFFLTVLRHGLQRQLVAYLLNMEGIFFRYTLGDLRRIAYQLAARNRK